MLRVVLWNRDADITPTNMQLYAAINKSTEQWGGIIVHLNDLSFLAVSTCDKMNAKRI